MSELTVGSLAGLASNGFVVDVKAGSTLDLSAGAVFPAGSVIQVVSTAKTDTFSTTSTSFTTVTGMTASITPKSTSSKILIMVQVVGSQSNANSSKLQFRLSGGNSGNYVGNADSNKTRATVGHGGGNTIDLAVMAFTHNIIYLDSPATDSAITYALELKTPGGTALVNRSSTEFDAAFDLRGASSITLMEIAG
jgi:hypothetical protein